MSDAPGRSSSSGETGIARAPREEPTSALPVAREQGAEPYRPLSVPAILGLGLAIGYALLISAGGLIVFYARFPRTFGTLLVLAPLLALLGGALARERRAERLGAYAGLGLAGLLGGLGMFSLVAFSGSNPWLVPGWTLLLPVAAVLTSWMARITIQKSEGTLDGLKLTTWGLALSLVFGLNYAAYYASTFLAVRQQATGFAGEWLDEIKKGDMPRAFLMTQPPGARPAGAIDRDTLEITFNAVRPPAEPGAYSGFHGQNFVRFIQVSGAQTEFEVKNVAVEYAKNAYDVSILYLVKRPSGNFNLAVRLRSFEPTAGDPVRRWQVLPNAAIQDVPDPPQLGPDMAKFGSGATVALRWVEQLNAGQFDRAYLTTLPPAERERQSNALAVGGLLPLIGPPPPLALTLVGGEKRRDFLAGGLVREDGKYGGETFWSSRKDRAKVVRAIKNAFHEAPNRPHFALSQAEMPLWKQEGKTAQLVLTARTELPEVQDSKLAIESGLVLQAEVGEGGPSPSGWRVVALELRRAHRVTRPAGGPPRR